ncbi:MAG: alpha/beta fold hydrolase [Candidatus Falkowbacteria bacterium]
MNSIGEDTIPELYRQGNNNHAILLLHGFAVNIERTDTLYHFLCRKGFTVARPILPGHTGLKKDLKSFGPDDWLAEANRWYVKLAREHANISLVGVSFGGMLCLRLASIQPVKPKSIILLELPLFFSPKISLGLKYVQPILELFGVEFVSKRSKMYRKNSLVRPGAFDFLPVKPVGQIRRFINSHALKDLKSASMPICVVQAERSDLLASKKIIDQLAMLLDKNKCLIEAVPTDNHDLDVLDEPGKMLMLEKIYQFILSTET